MFGRKIMKKILLVIILNFGLFNFAYSQEEITKISKPKEVSIEVGKSQSIPKEFEGLTWNRWTSKNFIVCSLNDTQAQYLHRHLELVKGWTLTRWGIEDIDLSVPCKLICVDGKDLFKKLFSLENTKVEIRRNNDGQISETVIFLLIEGPPSQTVPVPLAEVCIAELAQKNYQNFAPWVYKGMSHLNSTLDQIKNYILRIKPSLDKNEPLFYSKALFELDKEQYKKLTEEQRKNYDSCSVIMCLFIRKEFGQDSYLKFLQKATEDSPEQAVKEILKFESYDNFDKTFKRYMVDLTNDLVAGKTPDTYLQVTEKAN
jgi:hypothetical protein